MKLNATPRREQAVQHLLVHRMPEAEAGCDGTVWPRNFILFNKELLMT